MNPALFFPLYGVWLTGSLAAMWAVGRHYRKATP